MSLPTESDLQLNMANALVILDAIDVFARDSYLPAEQTMLDAAVQDYSPELAPATRSLRSRLSGCVEAATARTILDPFIRTYGRIIASPESNTSNIVDDIHDWFITQGYEVYSRNLSYGSVSSSGNSGNGTVNYLTVDENGYEIENCTPEVRKFKCIADEHSGAPEHEETFSVFGEAPGRDIIDYSAGAGTGINVSMSAISARNSLLRNPSFSSYSGTAATPTSVSGWTINTIGNVAIDTTNYYRDSVGDTTPAGLKITGNITCAQNLNVNNVRLDANTPYYLQLAYNRSIGSGDGNLTIQIGNTSATVALVAQSGWNILRLALDKNLWFKNMNVENITVTITIASRTSGYTIVDDVILTPMTQIDGLWYCIVGGSTPFLLDDQFTITSTEGATTGDGIINKWLYRAYNKYLPHTTDLSASSWTGDPF